MTIYRGYGGLQAWLTAQILTKYLLIKLILHTPVKTISSANYKYLIFNSKIMYLRLASLCAYLKYHFFLLLIWESFLATIWQLLFQVKCWSFWVSVWAWRWASWWRSRWTWPQPRWSQRPRLRTRQEGCFLCQYQKNVQTVSEFCQPTRPCQCQVLLIVDCCNLFPEIQFS